MISQVKEERRKAISQICLYFNEDNKITEILRIIDESDRTTKTFGGIVIMN